MRHEVPRFLFDANFSKRCVRSVEEMLKKSGAEVECAWQPELFGHSSRDEDWIPRCKSGRWMIITADRGRGGRSKGSPLPFVCHSFGINFVLVSKSIQQARGNEERVRAIKDNLAELIQSWSAPAGSSFRLRYKDVAALPPGRERRIVLEMRSK